MSGHGLRRLPYHRPRSIAEALEVYGSTEGARFIAGGTDLLVRIKDGRERPSALVSLRGIEELRAITVDGGETTIGAQATLTEIATHPAVRERYPVLCEAVSTIASVQIRNVATLGGNLCRASPCADGAPPLIVLGARVRVTGGAGSREIPVEELFTGPGQTRLEPGELLTSIVLAPVEQPLRGAYLKQGRVRIDLAFASIAAQLRLGADGETCEKARIAAGAVAPTPVRLSKVEELLVGERITPELLDRAYEIARDEVRPITDVRATADHRRHISGVLCRRAVERIVGWRAA